MGSLGHFRKALVLLVFSVSAQAKMNIACGPFSALTPETPSISLRAQNAIPESPIEAFRSFEFKLTVPQGIPRFAEHPNPSPMALRVEFQERKWEEMQRNQLGRLKQRAANRRRRCREIIALSKDQPNLLSAWSADEIDKILMDLDQEFHFYEVLEALATAKPVPPARR